MIVRRIIRLVLGAVVVSVALVAPQVTASPQASAATDPAVWVGSPMNATWPNTDGCSGSGYMFPSATCSLPAVHHWLAYAPLGDWAADLQHVAVGQPVVLYAAPQNTSLSVTAKVAAVGPACGSGVIAYGGYRVTVNLYTGSTYIGSVTYAHINPKVSQGQVISRWGTTLGTVGSYTSNSCWGGVHVHVQLYSAHNYACYNRGWHPGQQMYAKNFIGFIGGNYASGPRQACP